MTILTSKAVEDVFVKCLFTDGENVGNHIAVRGVVSNFGFCPERVEEQKETVRSLLSQLPPEFQASGGGGYSFLNGCMRSDGEQWGEQRNVEQLFCIGMACGLVSELLPVALMPLLPGGVPYYVVSV